MQINTRISAVRMLGVCVWSAFLGSCVAPNVAVYNPPERILTIRPTFEGNTPA